jgi:hypothetical protein
MKHFLVLDIECFTGGIIKELAIASPYFASSFLFHGPTSFNQLTTQKQKENVWLTRNLHGITWESGTFAYKALGDILSLHVGTSGTIYVKGDQKIKALKQYLPFATYVNLETIGCPTMPYLLGLPEYQKLNSDCPSYSTHNSATFSNHCAHKKAIVFCQWLLFNYQDTVANQSLKFDTIRYNNSNRRDSEKGTNYGSFKILTRNNKDYNDEPEYTYPALAGPPRPLPQLPSETFIQ